MYGFPAAWLSDNAAVFSGESRRGKVIIEAELESLGIRCIHSTPYHPQTCGKVERFHQTLKRFLTKQAAPHSVAHLQLQLDAFRSYYNQQRPHRAHGGKTPLFAFDARLKAKPDQADSPTHFRVRKDKVDRFGRVTLRYLGRLRHIGLGMAYKDRSIRLLVAGDHVRVVTDEGSLLRELTLDPTRDYQRIGGRTLVHDVVRHVSAMSCDMVGGPGFEPGASRSRTLEMPVRRRPFRSISSRKSGARTHHRPDLSDSSGGLLHEVLRVTASGHPCQGAS